MLNKEAVRWSAVKRYISTVLSGILRRKIRIEDAVGEEIGYTQAGNTIFISNTHPFFEKVTEEEKRTIQLGVAVHEAMHQCFTNFDYLKVKLMELVKAKEFRNDYEKKMFVTVWNLIEDPAIEAHAHEKCGGVALKALYYEIQKLHEIGHSYGYVPEFAVIEILNVLVDFGDVGIVPGNFVFPEAQECFVKIAPMFYEAINEPDNQKRIDMAYPIFQEIRPLWADYPENIMSSLFEKIKELFEKMAKDSGEESLYRSGSGSNAKATSEDSGINRMRKITIKEVSRDEYERMKEEAKETEEAEMPEGDIEIVIPEDLNEDDLKEAMEGDKKGASIPIPIPMPQSGTEKNEESEGSSFSEETSEEKTEDGSAKGKASGNETETSATAAQEDDCKGTDAQSGTGGSAQEDDESSTEEPNTDKLSTESGTDSSESSEEGGSETTLSNPTDSEDESDGDDTQSETGKSVSEEDNCSEEQDPDDPSCEGWAGGSDAAEEDGEDETAASSGVSTDGSEEPEVQPETDGSMSDDEDPEETEQYGDDEIDVDDYESSTDSSSANSSESSSDMSDASESESDEMDGSLDNTKNFDMTSKVNPHELTDDEEAFRDEYSYAPEMSEEDMMSILDGIDKEETAHSDEEDDHGDYYEPIPELTDNISSEFPQFERVRANNRYIEDDRDLTDQYDEVVENLSEYIEPLKDELKDIFYADRVKKIYSESGKVNVRRLATKKTLTVFERRLQPDHKDDVCFCVVVDNSGSTRGEKVKQEKIACIGMAEALAEYDIPLYVFSFQTFYDEGDTTQTHYIRWDNTRFERERLLYMEANGGNFDSYSIRYATKLLSERKEKNKILIVISDGCPTDWFSGYEGIKQNRLAIEDARNEKIHVLGIGVGNVEDSSFSEMYTKDYYLKVEKPSDLFDNLADRIVKFIDEGE